MKLEVRVRLADDARDRVTRDEGLRAEPWIGQDWITVDVDSSAFDRLLKVTEQTGGMWYTPYAVPSAQELAQSSCFKVRPKKLLMESDRDTEYNAQRLHETPLTRTQHGTWIRILGGLMLSRIELRPNEIGNIGDWTEEYAVPVAAARALRTAGAQGFSTHPLLHPRSGRWEEFGQLWTDNLMPPATADCSTRADPDPTGEPGFRAFGCLAYSDPAGLLCGDFARTAEAWAAHGQPTWIVSRRVFEIARGGSIRGWSFMPVLDVRQASYAEYLSSWRALWDAMSQNPANRLW